MNSYLIIDTSYTVFYRFYSTKIWYKLAHPEDNFETNYNWFENEIFRECFERKYIESIEKLAKKYYIKNNKIIFACDCARHDIWRMKYSKEYKQNREGKYGKTEGKVDIGPFFLHVYKTIIPRLSEKYGCFLLKEKHLEADDIIALVKRYLSEKNKTYSFVIVTSDLDLLQLRDEKTTLIDLRNKDLSKKSLGSPELDLNIKIICGDKSDNIKGCFKRCGKKTALKLIHNKDDLEKRFNKEKLSREIYNLNKLLIDLNNIPADLSEIFFNYVKNIL